MRPTPKEKANQLLDYYWLLDKVIPPLSREQAIQCALIVVDEILEDINIRVFGLFYLKSCKYWNKVKQELEKL